MSGDTPFSRHGSQSVRHASAGYFKQYTTAFSILDLSKEKRTEHSFCRYLRAETVYPYLYIKQPYTPPGVSCCQPPKLVHKLRIDVRLTKLKKVLAKFAEQASH